jgi:hypothetical protein
MNLRSVAGILFALFLLPCRLVAQVFNVDREVVPDSSYQSWAFSAGLNIATDKQKNSIFDLSSNAEIDRFFKNNYLLIAAFRNEAVLLGGDAIQNEGLAHIRFRDRDTRKLSWEGYAQYQWNSAWGMDYRIVLGNNLRFKFLEKRKADLYFASGIFQEWEKWNWSGVKPELVSVGAADRLRNMFRLNEYLKYAIKLNDQVDVSAVSYLQFPLKGRFLQPRWHFDTNVFLHVGKHLSFNVSWNHVIDNNRLVPIDRFYYSFSTGLQYER